MSEPLDLLISHLPGDKQDLVVDMQFHLAQKPVGILMDFPVQQVCHLEHSGFTLRIHVRGILAFLICSQLHTCRIAVLSRMLSLRPHAGLPPRFSRCNMIPLQRGSCHEVIEGRTGSDMATSCQMALLPVPWKQQPERPRKIPNNPSHLLAAVSTGKGWVSHFLLSSLHLLAGAGAVPWARRLQCKGGCENSSPNPHC